MKIKNNCITYLKIKINYTKQYNTLKELKI